jgi:fatty-acyl-CoA synthase
MRRAYEGACRGGGQGDARLDGRGGSAGGARVVCAHADCIEAIGGIRDRSAGVEHFVALEGSGNVWIDCESILASHLLDFSRVEIAESDLLTIDCTS